MKISLSISKRVLLDHPKRISKVFRLQVLIFKFMYWFFNNHNWQTLLKILTLKSQWSKIELQEIYRLGNREIEEIIRPNHLLLCCFDVRFKLYYNKLIISQKYSYLHRVIGCVSEVSNVPVLQGNGKNSFVCVLCNVN